MCTRSSQRHITNIKLLQLKATRAAKKVEPDGHLERHGHCLFPFDRSALDPAFPGISGSGKMIREPVIVVAGIADVVEVDQVLRPSGNFAGLDRFDLRHRFFLVLQNGAA